ncbi:TrbI/VirB10 family protein (plasmid) [Arsenophonus nasoniae]|uniref:Type IV secretion system protein virB10 n=1 Tax=Arsenophonus nasoniae TaxID=638 RepID=A0A4P7L9E5_9GAMM|nr:TrbI/VirB10 family protein [Arsenophonus nasoniae]QBY46894.1 Type IV secretion system protein virB10 [Arsenophonus nasoniae]WGM13864.1 TrbI/VirB10 family protein [Arsenophonus nasoniae]WGM18514.1 TrbI/VirB10 family protein [Arsenophonus nasoniae]
MSLFDKFKRHPVDNEIKKTTELAGDRHDIHVFTVRQKRIKHVMLIGGVILLGVSVLLIFGFYYFKKPPVVVYKPKPAEEEQYQRKERTSQAILDFKRAQARTENQTLDDVKKDVEKKENKAIEIEEKSDDKNIINLDKEEKDDSHNEKTLTPTERRRQGEVLLSAKEITARNQKENTTPSEKTNTIDNKDFLKGAKYQDGQVGFIRHRPFLLSAGTTMPCVLKTKIITSYPSIALCQLTKNVYSDDGKNILIRAGALLQGEQTRVLKKGVARVFVNWATVKDGNVRVHIDALGADGLGASGLPAWIDNHFWERFGGAMLLSFVDDALAAAASNISKENTSLSIDNTRSATKSMAELALENSIGIPPTAYVNQGEMLSVIVPRNIDFSPVYKNQ